VASPKLEGIKDGQETGMLIRARSTTVDDAGVMAGHVRGPEGTGGQWMEVFTWIAE
jgi:hypothetical protein